MPEQQPRKCPHCANGNKPRIRKDTGELVHDFVSGRTYSQTLCHNDPKFGKGKEK